MIYLLTAIGLTPDGSSTVHIYTQTIHRTTQSTQTINRTLGVYKFLTSSGYEILSYAESPQRAFEACNEFWGINVCGSP